MSLARRIARQDIKPLSVRAQALHPEVDRLLTDAELWAAHRAPPLHVARSARLLREWRARIARRLAVPEHVRKAFAQKQQERSRA
jgi:hypothetical protein